jgi:hypothetical protein
MSERATVSRARLSTRVSPRASSRWPPGIVIAVACIVSVGLLAQTWDSIQSDPPSTCDLCEAWNAAQQPFRVFANTYYVGVAGLSAILITSSRGHVLLDGGLPQSAPRIDASIRSLGFRTDDVVLIASSHAHFDHAGGIAALQRRSGATVAASAAGARALEHGEPVPDDPQFAFGRARMGFPSVSRARIVADNETVRAGGLAITAHLTPGHTPAARAGRGGRATKHVVSTSFMPTASTRSRRQPSASATTQGWSNAFARASPAWPDCRAISCCRCTLTSRTWARSSRVERGRTARIHSSIDRRAARMRRGRQKRSSAGLQRSGRFCPGSRARLINFAARVLAGTSGPRPRCAADSATSRRVR